MVSAFILIRSDSGSERELLESLEDCDEVEDVEIIYGEWDIIAKIAMEGDVSTLNDFILNKIRPLTGVRQTSTLISTG
jgi:DNA-binding Lrp family transcriptional regulator